MNINIYYGGRGIVDDPSLYVSNKMADVLRELNVQVKQYNLYEDKNGITALSNTLKEADGIILSSTVEWFGIGGYLMEFLDSCWLYADKEKISHMYMMPVVMSTTYGEREGIKNLETAWEILGGLPCDGICGYIARTNVFEENADYIRLIEKKAENLYRTISQKMPALPASNQVVKQKVSMTKSAGLTPQESEQLSRYVSDDRYVKTQKADIQELSSFFRGKLKNDETLKNVEEYLEVFKKSFNKNSQISGIYGITINDAAKTIILSVDKDKLDAQLKDYDNESLDVYAQLDLSTLTEILEKRITFQGAFMAGKMKVKGDFRLLRGLDQMFEF